VAVCYVGFQKSNLKIEMILGYAKPNVDSSESILKFNDPMKIGEQKIRTYKDGTSEYLFVMKVQNKKEMEYAKLIIQQKYDSMN
jgi:hypothetical protein